MGKLSVIVGGQFGSEAKGAVTSALTQKALARRERPVIVRVAGPNAGHTAYDASGRAWALRQVPAGMVHPGTTGVIADGSEVDLPVLLDEMRQLDEAGLDVSSRLFISGRASLLTEAHHKREENAGIHGLIGSTGKGIGECRADRLMRRVPTLGQAFLEGLGQELEGTGETWEHIRAAYYPHTAPEFINKLRVRTFNLMQGGAVDLLQRFLREGRHVLIEGTQGYGLGLHGEHYPRCTSSDTRAIDFLAMAGLNPWDQIVSSFRVWVVARAFPIRVAGNSGPLHEETTWEELGLPVELTTVTHKPRRVGKWDQQLLNEAIAANGGSAVVRVAYTMADQETELLKGLSGRIYQAHSWEMDPEEPDTVLISDAVQAIWDRTNGLVRYIGTGPNSHLEVVPGVR